MVFIRNWKWFQENPSSTNRVKNDYTDDFGLPIELEIINNQLTMQFVEPDKAISRIWFQLSIPSNELNFEVAKFINQFDISLETNAGEMYILGICQNGTRLNCSRLHLAS